MTQRDNREAGRRAHARRAARGRGGAGSGVGEILVAAGDITREQLDEALLVQQQDPREVGRILLSLGAIAEADLARALARRLRLQYVELTERDVDRGVAGLVDSKVLRKHGVMPLRLQGGCLVVATSNPTDFYALEDVSMLSGYPVTAVVAAETEIRSVHDRVLGMGSEVAQLLEEAQEPAEDGEKEVELSADGGAENAPVVRLVSSVLQQAVAEGASDIHIEPNDRELAVRFRVDGVLREVMGVPRKLQSEVIARLKILGDLDIAERRLPQDGRFSVRLGDRKTDLRVATLPTVFGEKVVLRLLDATNVEIKLSRLGFSPEILKEYQDIFRQPYGTVLVTGPTGSGKSTTLYATLAELNSPEKNVITVEDPVEYRMRGINQMQVNPRVGLTFASGLRSILRADPDVVMIGEIRDFETAKASVEAALTGHLVLATLHTSNAPAAVTRLTDMGVEPFLTASAVDCVIAQRLARRLCTNCKRATGMDESVLAGLGFPFGCWPGGDFAFHEPVGCDRCGGVGYRGRVGVYELMVVGDEVKALIVARVSTGDISRVVEEAGMLRLKDDGLIKAAQGITAVEEVLRTVV